ncbi:MAG: hypothetical protein AAF371_09900 [Pseudomonadota bacterium]
MSRPRRIALFLAGLAPVLVAGASAPAQTLLETERENTLAIVRQIGDVATAVSGGQSLSGIEQIGDVGSVRISQTGQDNAASVVTDDSEADQRAVILQHGAANRAQVLQQGEAAAVVVQSGPGNVAVARQEGGSRAGNATVILQSGRQNTAVTSQASIAGALFEGFGAPDGNRIVAVQNGTQNSITADQTGEGNTAALQQDGLFNTIDVGQDGNKTIFVNQSGVGHFFEFDQTGADTAPMIVTQEGARAPPVTVTRAGPGR